MAIFSFFLSIMIVCSSGIFLLPGNAIEQKEVEKQELAFRSVHRGLLYRAIRHDFTDAPATNFPTTPVTNPATTPVTNPVTTPAANVPPVNPAPDIVTVPGGNPFTVNPTPPATNPVPNAGPVNGAVPVTNPVTPPTNPGGQPVTNPVTTYPSPIGGVPATNPVTNPVAPPTTTNAPAVPGQSWCVAKNGVAQTMLQSALDYACGIGGADCSAIQQGASCYNPNSLQYHASYAFNSYYQKNPAQTSCDFGGTAAVTSANPSTGSCIFPTSASSTSSSSPITTTPTPTPTIASSTGAAPGASTPSVLNTSTPGLGGAATGFGEGPSNTNASTSMSTSLQPHISCIVILTSIVAARFVYNI